MNEREDRRNGEERQPQIDPAEPQQDQPGALHPYLFVAIVAFACNLRPGLVTLGPLLPAVARGLAMSPFAMGVLTALPVLALGIGSAFADRIGRRLGWGNAILATALLIALGIGIRSSGDAGFAYLGALLLGLGTGFGGVFVPALFKARATRIGVAMGAYSLALVTSSTISVGSTPAIAHAFGGDWRPTLAVWAIPALIAAGVWLPLRSVNVPPNPIDGNNVVVWRSPLAWAVALNMGLQATLFYSLASWLPTLLIDRGIALDAAALDLSFFFLPQIATALFAPIVLARTRHQGLVAASAMAFAGVSLVGALYGPVAWIPLGCVILGSGLGFVFAIALTFLVLRSRSPQTAATLSGMAQTGYVMAASGPLVLGILRTAPDPRLASTLWMSALVLGAIVTGAVAGRQAFVDP